MAFFATRSESLVHPAAPRVTENRSNSSTYRPRVLQGKMSCSKVWETLRRPTRREWNACLAWREDGEGEEAQAADLVYLVSALSALARTTSSWRPARSAAESATPFMFRHRSGDEAVSSALRASVHRRVNSCLRKPTASACGGVVEDEVEESSLSRAKREALVPFSY